MTRRLLPAAAAFPAFAFLVFPSLARLAFLLERPVATDPTDVAFLEQWPTGFLHVAAGLAMVVLMPIQLSGTIRRQWPLVHRWSGRLFVLVGLSVSLTAMVMNVVFPVVGGLLKVTVIFVMAIAQLATLSLGVRAILMRDVASHRKWMLRAVGVALAAARRASSWCPFTQPEPSLTSSSEPAGGWGSC